MTSTDLVVPGTGEVLPLASATEIAAALEHVDELMEALKLAKRQIALATIDLSKQQLTKTFELPDGRKLTLSSGSATEYDAAAIYTELVDGEFPEAVIDQIVVEKPVEYRVDARRAKAAAAANPSVKAIIERHSKQIEKTQYASIEGTATRSRVT